jgi:hypothetical protein
MSLCKQIEAFIVSLGLLSPSHLKWERIAGVWFFCTLAVMVLLIVVFVLDIVFLDRVLFPVLRVLGMIALGSLFGAMVLIVAATNNWIL